VVLKKSSLTKQNSKIIWSCSIAAAWTIPVLAATVAFVVYSATNPHDFDAAIIFSSLALFSLLRQPLLFLPRSLSAITDGRNAFERLSKVFHADVMDSVHLKVVPDQTPALRVVDATFEWEESPMEREIREKQQAEKAQKGKGSEKDNKGKGMKTPPAPPLAPGGISKPFQMMNVDMEVARGTLVAIVGPVGSGKVFSCALHKGGQSLISFIRSRASYKVLLARCVVRMARSLSVVKLRTAPRRPGSKMQLW
jgi:ATP-binding cassette, subfamily C (CFTR/MRP), member 1